MVRLYHLTSPSSILDVYYTLKYTNRSFRTAVENDSRSVRVTDRKQGNERIKKETIVLSFQTLKRRNFKRTVRVMAR